MKAYVASLGEEGLEWLLALFVDNDLRLLSVETIARGTVSECRVNLGHIVSRAFAVRAAGFILVHNHPSGDPRPSRDDINLTVRLAHIAKDLDIPLLDHLIIAGEQMTSVAGF